AAAGTAAPAAPAAGTSPGHGHGGVPLPGVKHLVVIYQENHSFDNLYGSWGRVGGRVLDGTAAAVPSGGHVTQVAQDGTPYRCLLQNDVNLTSPSPLPTTCTDAAGGTAVQSHFRNRAFRIEDYNAPGGTPCRPPGGLGATG